MFRVETLVNVSLGNTYVYLDPKHYRNDIGTLRVHT